MKRRFILVTENLTPEEETQLRASLGTPYLWHWLPNAWLLLDLVGSVTVNTIRDAFRLIAPSKQCLVLEVDHKQWASMEKKTPNGTLSDWIKSSWVTP